MRRLILIGLLSVLVMVILVSCRSRKLEKQVLQDPVILTQTKEVKVVEKDTIFKIEADSTFYKAFIECRDGKPKIISPSIQKGRDLLPPKVNIDQQGNLTVSIQTQARELLKKWQETYTKEVVPKPIYVDKIVYKDTPFTWYHKALMWSGGLFLFIVGGVSLASLIRLYKR